MSEYSNAIDLSNALRTSLGALLGQFADGRTAIWVEPGQAPKPGSGLHCYLQRYPQQQTGDRDQWIFRLRLYGGGNPQSLHEGMASILRKFPVANHVVMPWEENQQPEICFYLPRNKTTLPDY